MDSHKIANQVRGVFVGPIEIAGFGTSLVAGLRQIGIRSEAIDVSGNRFRYVERLGDKGFAKWINTVAHGLGSTKAGHWVLWKLGFNWMLRGIVLLRALFLFDVFVFVYGRTLLPGLLDLWLLKLLKKKTVFVFLGSDSRPLILNGAYLSTIDWLQTPEARRKLLKRQIKMSACLLRIDRLADIVIDSPLSGHSHSRWCANWFKFGCPYAVPVTTEPFPEMDILRILHAPSKAAYKGTQLIREAVQRAQAAGIPIYFEELSNQPNHEVIEAIKRCHLVIDELYSDTGLAGFGVEAASQGKIVVVGGEQWDQVDAWMGESPSFPSVRVRADQIEETLHKLWDDRANLPRLASAHHKFMLENWDAQVVAARLVSWVTNGVPEAARFLPSELDSLKGMGAPANVIEAALRAMLESVPPSCLGFRAGTMGARALDELKASPG